MLMIQFLSHQSMTIISRKQTYYYELQFMRTRLIYLNTTNLNISLIYSDNFNYNIFLFLLLFYLLSTNHDDMHVACTTES